MQHIYTHDANDKQIACNVALYSAKTARTR